MSLHIVLGESNTYKGMDSKHKYAKDRWTKASKYIKRIFKYRQMDYQFAFWQIVYLFLSPQKVFRDFQYRKSSKDQFARDDPAFFIILLGMIVVSSIALAFTLDMGLIGCFKFMIWSTLFDCLFIGSIIATLFWYIANRFMTDSDSNHPRQDVEVEWAYAFDVHLNALFPLLLILHVILLPFITVIINNHSNRLSAAFGNLFWLVAISYYIYITFLGYSCLPNIHKSRLILTPLTIIFILYFISVAFNWNLTHHFVLFHKYRVL